MTYAVGVTFLVLAVFAIVLCLAWAALLTVVNAIMTAVQFVRFVRRFYGGG